MHVLKLQKRMIWVQQYLAPIEVTSAYSKNPKNHKRFNQDEKLKNYKIGFMMMCLWREQELARNEFAALDA